MTGQDHNRTKVRLRLLAAGPALAAGVVALILAIQLVRGVLG
jgi:hypothetical protein